MNSCPEVIWFIQNAESGIKYSSKSLFWQWKSQCNEYKKATWDSGGKELDQDR
jgi:hypothetical protein